MVAPFSEPPHVCIPADNEVVIFCWKPMP
jgi:hypothetical protein